MWPYEKVNVALNNGLKILHKRRVIPVLWVNWNAQFDGDIHFKFGPGKDNIRSNFQAQNFLAKTYLSRPPLS